MHFPPELIQRAHSTVLEIAALQANMVNCQLNGQKCHHRNDTAGEARWERRFYKYAAQLEAVLSSAVTLREELHQYHDENCVDCRRAAHNPIEAMLKATAPKSNGEPQWN